MPAPLLADPTPPMVVKVAGMVASLPRQRDKVCFQIPGTGSPYANWSNWSSGAPRDWFAQALWQALNSRFAVDPVP